MHDHILDEKQKSVLEILDELEIIQDFYLAGGTALALQYGHRKSADFDFFKEGDFNIDDLINLLSQKCEITVRVKKDSTLLFLIENISCSFFKYPYPLLFQLLDFKKNVKLVSIPDIAAMKVSAISTRGTKRDFIDLYFICQKDYSVEEVIHFYQKKFKILNHDLYHVYKSLMYFEDAESDYMPLMYEKTNWNDIKSFFQKKITELMK